MILQISALRRAAPRAAGALLLACPVSLFAGDWQPYPAGLERFSFEGDALAEQWDVLQRATVQEYPSEAWVVGQLGNEALCRATLQALGSHADFSGQVDGAENCSELDAAAVAAQLQQAWRDYFSGEYQGATETGEALGPIGYAVGGYARIVYGQVLAASAAEKRDVLEKAIEYADAYEAVVPGSAYSLFVSAYSMGRIMDDLSLTAALATGYNSQMKRRLEQLIETYPAHTKGLANYGGYNAGVIDKSGRLLARMTYGATPENMEYGFGRALEVEPPVVSNHVEYAIALQRVYGRSELDKARVYLVNMAEATPLEAEDVLEIRRARELLAEFDEKYGK